MQSSRPYDPLYGNLPTRCQSFRVEEISELRLHERLDAEKPTPGFANLCVRLYCERGTSAAAAGFHAPFSFTKTRRTRVCDVTARWPLASTVLKAVVSVAIAM